MKDLFITGCFWYSCITTEELSSPILTSILNIFISYSFKTHFFKAPLDFKPLPYFLDIRLPLSGLKVWRLFTGYLFLYPFNILLSLIGFGHLLIFFTLNSGQVSKFQISGIPGFIHWPRVSGKFAPGHIQRI